MSSPWFPLLTRNGRLSTPPMRLGFQRSKLSLLAHKRSDDLACHRKPTVDFGFRSLFRLEGCYDPFSQIKG